MLIWLQVLSELQSKMRPQPSYLNPSITEAWLRRYQVQQYMGSIYQIYDALTGSAGKNAPTYDDVWWRRLSITLDLCVCRTSVSTRFRRAHQLLATMIRLQTPL